MATSQSRLYNFVNDKNSSIPITASKVDGELDAVIAALNRKVIVAASAPSSPSDGDTWIDLSKDPPQIKIYDLTNAGWTTAPIIISSPTQGDIVYYDGTNWAKLGVGTSGYFLKTQGSGANPAWTAPTATDLNVASQAQGDILYYDGSNWVRLAKGTAAQILQINAGATAPEWTAPVSASMKVKAWAKFAGDTANGSVSPDASYNITSIVKDSTGNWTVTLDTNFSSEHYVVVFGHSSNDTDRRADQSVNTQAAGSFKIANRDANNSSTDLDTIMFMCIGAQ